MGKTFVYWIVAKTDVCSTRTLNFWVPHAFDANRLPEPPKGLKLSLCVPDI